MGKKILVKGKNHLTLSSDEASQQKLNPISISLAILKRLHDDDLAYLQETYGQDAGKYKTTYTKMYRYYSKKERKHNPELVIEKNQLIKPVLSKSHTDDDVITEYEFKKLPRDPYVNSAGILKQAVITHKASEKTPLASTNVTASELKPLYEVNMSFLRTKFGTEAGKCTTLNIRLYETCMDPKLSSAYKKNGNLNGTFVNRDGTVELVIPNLNPAKDVELAEKTFNAVGPRIIHLTDNHSKPAPFETDSKDYISAIVSGCGGNGSPAQRLVAETMNFLIGKPELRALFVGNLGDNWYKNIIDSPIHADFNKLFFLIYFIPELRNLYKSSIHGSFGNHCEGYELLENWKQRFAQVVPAAFKYPFGRAASKNILMQAYFTRLDGLTSPISPARLYTRGIKELGPNHVQMDLKDCSPLDIPYYFTSRILLDTFQLLYINTNDLPRYFMQYIRHITGVNLLKEHELQENQYCFMKRAYQYGKINDLIQVAMQHIPLYELKGREDGLFYNPDDDMIRLDLILQIPGFETNEWCAKAKIILTTSINHLRFSRDIPEPTVDRFSQNILLARIYKVSGWYFKVINCAHDHMLAYTNINGLEASFNQTWGGVSRGRINWGRPDDISNYPLCQVTSGGNGGDLQSLAVYTHIRYCYYIKSHGVAVLTFNKKTRTIDVNLITTLVDHYEQDKKFRQPGLHLRFIAGKSHPIQDLSKEPDLIDGQEIKRHKNYIRPLPILFQPKPTNNPDHYRIRLLYFINYTLDILNAYENDEPMLTKIEKNETAFLFKGVFIDKKIRNAISERKRKFLIFAKEYDQIAEKLRQQIKQTPYTNLDKKEFYRLLQHFTPKILNAQEFEYRISFINEFIDRISCVSENELENFVFFETLKALFIITTKEYQLFIKEKLTSNSAFYLTNTTHSPGEAALIRYIMNHICKHKQSIECTIIEVAKAIKPLKKIEGKHSFYDSLTYKLTHSEVLKRKTLEQLAYEAEKKLEQQANKPVAPVYK